MHPCELSRHAPCLEPLLHGADHVDVKTFTSARPLGEFTLRMLNYTPAWLKALFGLRRVLALVLRLKHVPADNPEGETPDIDYTPGATVKFFTTVGGEPGRYWVGEASDRHLAGYIAIVSDHSLDEPRIHAATIVHYRHWTGPLYFTLILPFHHLIVRMMGRYAART